MIESRIAQIKLRTDTTANWTRNNTVLAMGEMGVELTTDKKCLLKVGDGVTGWTNLSYISTKEQDSSSGSSSQSNASRLYQHDISISINDDTNIYLTRITTSSEEITTLNELKECVNGIGISASGIIESSTIAYRLYLQNDILYCQGFNTSNNSNETIEIDDCSIEDNITIL